MLPERSVKKSLAEQSMSGDVVSIIYTLSNLGKQSKIHGHYGWLNCRQLHTINRDLSENVYVSALISATKIKNKPPAKSNI